MITTFYPPYNFGGDGICVYRLANQLVRRGHSVDVIHCMDAYQLLQKEPVKDTYPKHADINLFPLKSASAFFSSLYTQQTGVPFFRSKIKDILANNDYDVIHYHNVSLIGITALAYGNALKLYTLHEHWLVCPMHLLWKYNREVCKKRDCFTCMLRSKRPPQLWRYTGLVKEMVRHVDSFIAPSQFTSNKHRELGLDIPIRCIPHFVPQSSKWDVSVSNQKASQKRPFFLFVGRLEKIKGLQNLIPVFRNMKQYDLVVAGDGEYADSLKKLSGNASNIRFLGKIGEEKLPELYRDAVATIVPSLCYEVFGIVIIESFAMKTPVIANNLGALPEVVRDSGGGFVYDNNDELLNAINGLAGNAELRDKMGSRGYQAYLKYWSEDRHINEYLSLINQLQNNRKLIPEAP